MLTQEQLRQVFDRVLQGEKISHIAKELGVNRSALNDRLKRRFSGEFSQAASAGVISNAAARRTYEENARNKARELESDPAVMDYLQSGESYQTVATRHGLAASSLHARVQKVLKLQKERAEALLPKT